jgi:hypothetical protein
MQRTPRGSRDAPARRATATARVMTIHHGALRDPGDRARTRVPCVRCGGDDRVVADDGTPVCMVCILAWGSYAAMVSASEPELELAVQAGARRDPTVTALLHWSHRVPIADCPLCLARR